MISVIIPTYNRASTIGRAVDSVLCQTYKELELIVVDDCSTDCTDDIMQEYMKKDKRVRYHKLDTNSGACVARNIGVKMARGKYIAFQDSDDEWLPEKLEKQMAYLKEKDADVCFCSIDNIQLDGSIQKIPTRKMHSNEVRKNLLRENFISTQAIFGKKECFINEKFDPRFPRMQDWDLVIRLSQKYKIVHLDDVLVKMYKQNDSMTFNTEKTVKGLYLLIEKYGNIMDDESLSRIYTKIANNQLKGNRNADIALKMANQYDPSLKKWLKYWLAKLKVLYIILPIYRRIKR